MATTGYSQITRYKTSADLLARAEELGIQLPFDLQVTPALDGALAQPYFLPDGRKIGNRFCIQPMEGWDGTTDGKPTELVFNRWRKFGRSGAKLIWGGEAAAVRPDGRANPNQLMILDETMAEIESLRLTLMDEHKTHYGTTDDLLVGLQLTHSGRFCRPNDKSRLEPKILYHHPLLDRIFNLPADYPVLTDEEIDDLIGYYVRAARRAQQIGFEFVDVKHCHSYLGHEFLSAVERPGRYGGSFENRTRFLREIVVGIRRDCPGLRIGVRLSAFDFPPFRPDENNIGKMLEYRDVDGHYPYAFGGDPENPGQVKLDEVIAFNDLLLSVGVELVNFSAGSPYYNPHVTRPAFYPPSDGYLPPEDPLVGVARQINVSGELKKHAPQLATVGSAYTYLQDYLPNVAQAAVRTGMIDFVGLGRMVLSYPEMPADILAGKPLARQFICRTFSDCTTAPRKGMVSGCYPLDQYYKKRPEAEAVKALKKEKLEQDGSKMKVVSFEEAVSYIHNKDTLMIGGSGGGHAVPEALIVALEKRYLEEGSPHQISLLHPVGLGDNVSQGVGHLAHPGLVKRIVAGALVNSPAFQKLAEDDEVEAYTLPQGALSELIREMASGRPGLLTQTGMHTFVDPRINGGRQSKCAQEDLIELVHLAGQDWLFYKPYHVDVTFLRGTTADEDGNVTMEREAIFGEMLSMAQATRRNGGIVIVQVARLAQRGTLPAKQVKIPAMLVDLVVVDPNQRQTYQMDYSPAYAGEIKVPLTQIVSLPLDPRKVIARRAALELRPGAICNLGSGVSTGIATIAAEEGILEQIVLTNEQGLIGGAPSADAGAAINYTSIVDQPYQFDFYDGGGLDLAFLSFAQVDQAGSVNVSRFNGRIIGVGGFINISQHAKKVIFSGTFTAGSLEMAWPDGKTLISKEGRFNKFVSQLEQVSYNGPFAREREQVALYITERAVFRRGEQGIELIEIAPGIDLDRDILAHMDFKPQIAKNLKIMDSRLFRAEPMGLAGDLMGKEPCNIPERLRKA